MPLRVIPDVADNSSLRQAQAKLLSAGFKLNEVQLVNGEKDWVYGVKYQGRQLTAGEKIPMGASLTLMVGDGAGDTVEEDSIDIDLDSNDIQRLHLIATLHRLAVSHNESVFGSLLNAVTRSVDNTFERRACSSD